MKVEYLTSLQDASGQWLLELSRIADLADDQQVYHLLSATLKTLRDHLRLAELARLGSQLPVLLRGLYYDGFRPAETPNVSRDRREFLARVESRYHARPLDDLEAGVGAVFSLLSNKLPSAEALTLVRALPGDLQACWPAALAGQARPQQPRAATG